MKGRMSLFIGCGVLVAFSVAVSLAFASGSTPYEEPVSSPYFEATLQQAVDELDGIANAPVIAGSAAEATQHYTTDPSLWKECEPGFTRDLVKWPACHYTTDPELWPEGCGNPYPTLDYTWDGRIWQACGADITQDPGFWCDPLWTRDPGNLQCSSQYTSDPLQWPWCQPRYTWDPQQWPDCPVEAPYYTEDPARWAECTPNEYTTDPYRWPECHYTSDPRRPDCIEEPYVTQDYTSSPMLWPECNPLYTSDPRQYPSCADPEYTTVSTMPWCENPTYTIDLVRWPLCHFTSDATKWPEACTEPYPTEDFTWDSQVWPGICGPRITYDQGSWWCDPSYTSQPDLWPGCNPAWTWDSNQWPECAAGYTTDVEIWPRCSAGLYTTNPAAWPECELYTAEASIWPECHYTSDPSMAECVGNWFPTKDYTTDASLWPECERPADYTSDPQDWPECHYTSDPSRWPECAPQYTDDPAIWPECDPAYTSDPQLWPECRPDYTQDPQLWPECHPEYTMDPSMGPECAQVEPGDLGDAPDSTSHFVGGMTAYAAIPAAFPTVFDPATGLPQGPKHWQPRADAWLGVRVTLENDADLLPDEDPQTNISPVPDIPDQDVADDGVQVPVPAPHCVPTVFTYTVTVPPGAARIDRYVNVWFDWTRDGDWQDMPRCPDGSAAPEWAVQNQVLPPLPPGVYVFSTPRYLPWNPSSANIPDIWMRISIANQPAPVVPGSNLADGRGPAAGYRHGETEDYRFVPPCPQPVADFVWDPPTICPTTTIQFWDTSTNSPTSWSWDFGDGLGTSLLQNPTYSYSVAGVGTYDVALTVSNVCGADTITKTLVVTDCTSQEPEYDIYIKDNDLDDGSVPSSSPWYIGPDVWVRHSQDGGTAHQNPIPGTTNYVYVRVRNRMASTVNNITVYVYWANVALGTSWPGSWGLIGSFGIGSLAGGGVVEQSIPWNTPYTTGHFCLRARADAPDDPVDSGPDTIAPTHWPPNNNNIAQKNVNIVDFPEIEHCGFTSTAVYTDVVFFDAFNTLNAQAMVDIEFDSADFPLGSGTIVLEPGGLWNRWNSLSGFNQSGDTLLPTAFPASMGGIQMGPYETARMTMTVAAEIDQRFTISIKEEVGATEVGGIDYVRRLPICTYLPIILKNF